METEKDNGSLENVFALLQKVNELLKENDSFINIADGSVIIRTGDCIREVIVNIAIPYNRRYS